MLKHKVGDIVWAKNKYSLWPALVKSLSTQGHKQTATVTLINKGTEVQVEHKNLKPFTKDWVSPRGWGKDAAAYYSALATALGVQQGLKGELCVNSRGEEMGRVGG